MTLIRTQRIFTMYIDHQDDQRLGDRVQLGNEWWIKRDFVGRASERYCERVLHTSDNGQVHLSEEFRGQLHNAWKLRPPRSISRCFTRPFDRRGRMHRLAFWLASIRLADSVQTRLRRRQTIDIQIEKRETAVSHLHFRFCIPAGCREKISIRQCWGSGWRGRLYEILPRAPSVCVCVVSVCICVHARPRLLAGEAGGRVISVYYSPECTFDFAFRGEEPNKIAAAYQVHNAFFFFFFLFFRSRAQNREVRLSNAAVANRSRWK